MSIHASTGLPSFPFPTWHQSLLTEFANLPFSLTRTSLPCFFLNSFLSPSNSSLYRPPDANRPLNMRILETRQADGAVPSGKEASMMQDHELSVNGGAGSTKWDAADMEKLGMRQQTKACAHAPAPCNAVD